LLGATQNGEDGTKHEESNQSLTARRKKSPGELKLDNLGHTVAENFPGQTKHGRTMNQTFFNKVAITQVTSPVVKKGKHNESSKTLDPFYST
jgi:hypothetical protein